MQKSGIRCAAIGCHDKAVLHSKIEYNVVLLISKMRLLWESKLPLHAPKNFSTRGASTIVVDGTPIALGPGDVIVVEPGEVHTFAESTPDYFHFVLHCPPVRGDKVVME